MLPSEAILILRNTGHTAEWTYDNRFIIDGDQLTREELLSLASDQEIPDLLL